MLRGDRIPSSIDEQDNILRRYMILVLGFSTACPRSLPDGLQGVQYKGILDTLSPGDRVE